MKDKNTFRAHDSGLTAVSLFSGCGGLDLGFELAGIKMLLGTDSESRCAESSKINFPDVPFIEKRIGEISNEDLNKVLGKAANSVDLLIGGPPCPPFSKSRFYRKEKLRGLDDPVGNETITGYMRVLEYLKPRAFLLENVRGLAYKVHRDSLDYILETGEKLGYSCSWQILNAADYGVPQIRERCFVVGIRGAQFRFPSPTHTSGDTDDLVSQTLKPWVTAGDAICDLDTEEFASDEGHFAGGKDHELLKLVPPGDNYLFFTKERGHADPKFKWRSRYWSFLLKLSPVMPSWTIQARRSNNMGPFHWRNRILRIDEIKRLQSFPDTWFLSGNIEQQWRQIGNAVPPKLAQALASELTAQLGALDKESYEREAI